MKSRKWKRTSSSKKAWPVRFDFYLHVKEEATTEDFSVVQKEGTRNVTRKVKCYNLDAICGDRENSSRADYRNIMRIFYTENEKMRFKLYKEDIYERMIQMPGFEDYAIDGGIIRREYLCQGLAAQRCEASLI